MKHYFLIMLMTWGAMLFVTVCSWIILLTGLDFGGYTIFAAGVLALILAASLMKTQWFILSIKEPITFSMERGTGLELFIHLQIFAIVCGVLGMGGSLSAVLFLQSSATTSIFETLDATEEQWAILKHNAPVATLGGFLFGVMMYIYMLADAKNLKWLTTTIFIVGCISFFILGRSFDSG